jgi:hypothetical protein
VGRWCPSCTCYGHYPASDYDDIPHARNTDPDTSHQAAARLRAGKNADKMLRVYHGHPQGLIFTEAGQLAGLDEHEAGRRRSDLLNKGFIETRVIDGKPFTRVNPASGRRCEVQVITMAGRNRLQEIS